MKVLSKGNFKNIGKNQEFIDVELENGKTMRLIVDLETDKVRLIADHMIHRNATQLGDIVETDSIEKYTRVVELEFFGEPC